MSGLPQAELFLMLELQSSVNFGEISLPHEYWKQIPKWGYHLFKVRVPCRRCLKKSGARESDRRMVEGKRSRTAGSQRWCSDESWVRPTNTSWFPTDLSWWMSIIWEERPSKPVMSTHQALPSLPDLALRKPLWAQRIPRAPSSSSTEWKQAQSVGSLHF